jgi:hypothetical protein
MRAEGSGRVPLGFLKCRVNRVAVRFPAFFLVGALLWTHAGPLADSAFLYYGGGILAGTSMALLLLLFFAWRNRGSRAVWFGGALAGLYAAGRTVRDFVRQGVGRGAGTGGLGVGDEAGFGDSVLDGVVDEAMFALLVYCGVVILVVAIYLYVRRNEVASPLVLNVIAAGLRVLATALLFHSSSSWQVGLLAVAVIIVRPILLYVLDWAMGLWEGTIGYLVPGLKLPILYAAAPVRFLLGLPQPLAALAEQARREAEDRIAAQALADAQLKLAADQKEEEDRLRRIFVDAYQAMPPEAFLQQQRQMQREMDAEWAPHEGRGRAAREEYFQRQHQHGTGAWTVADAAAHMAGRMQQPLRRETIDVVPGSDRERTSQRSPSRPVRRSYAYGDASGYSSLMAEPQNGIGAAPDYLETQRGASGLGRLHEATGAPREEDEEDEESIVEEMDGARNRASQEALRRGSNRQSGRKRPQRSESEDDSEKEEEEQEVEPLRHPVPRTSAYKKEGRHVRSSAGDMSDEGQVVSESSAEEEEPRRNRRRGGKPPAPKRRRRQGKQDNGDSVGSDLDEEGDDEADDEVVSRRNRLTRPSRKPSRRSSKRAVASEDEEDAESPESDQVMLEEDVQQPRGQYRRRRK